MVKYFYEKYSATSTVVYDYYPNSQELEYEAALADVQGNITNYFTKRTFNSSTGTWSLSSKATSFSYNTDYFINRDGVHWSYFFVNNPETKIKYVICYKYRISSSTTYSKGSYIAGVTAEDGTYPTNGRHTDGYWYVRGTIANNAPTLSLSTPTDGRTIYENDILTLSGAATDVDAGNVVSIKYKIDGGTTRAISANISQGAAISFAKNLTYKSGMLYDGTNAVTGELTEGAQHVVTVWAEDDQGGKSSELSRTFYVVANRPAQLTLNAFATQSNLIDTDKITIGGSVTDPDNNPVTVQYKIGNGQFKTAYNGQSGAFSFGVKLSDLSTGANTLTLQAIDSHAAVTQQVLKVTKTADETPVNEAVAYFKISPPNGTTDGIVLWIEREVGDLVVSAEVSMTNDATENFVPMTLERTSYISDTAEEDQFAYEHTGAASNVVVRLTMKRTNTASNKAVKLFSGVLS